MPGARYTPRIIISAKRKFRRTAVHNRIFCACRPPIKNLRLCFIRKFGRLRFLVCGAYDPQILWNGIYLCIFKITILYHHSAVIKYCSALLNPFKTKRSRYFQNIENIGFLHFNAHCPILPRRVLNPAPSAKLSSVIQTALTRRTGTKKLKFRLLTRQVNPRFV